ncbi:hypothetical protein SLEP1_g26938 [Rubroshorea leprosula]|uniref:Cytochrome P450 n=1 Tax=Rubroshorea leprosula TaxID=152421 RepID=A0AAV5K188_9ROSI|nr:hypothetical protein SLEP1_g26938 [Rubroshorea leprosula]
MSNFYDNVADSLAFEVQSWWWAVFVVALAMAISWYARLMIQKSSKTRPSLPPGPPGLPLLGNLPFLESQLHLYLTRLSQTYGPIFKLRLGSKTCIIVNSPELAKVILKDQDAIFANRDVPASALEVTYGGVDIAWSPNGPHWQKLRKIFVRGMMSNASLDACYSLRRREVREMVKDIHGKVGSPINIADQMFLTVLNVITSMLWGGTILYGQERCSIGVEFRQVVGEIVELLGKPNISDFFPALAPFDLQGIQRKMKKLSLWFDRFFESVLAGQTKYEGKEETKDLLQFLLELKDQDDEKTPCLSMEEIKALFVDIVVAATDTTSTTVEWAMTEMLQHPEIMRRACEELDEVVGKQNIVEESHLPRLIYLEAFMKETLRLHPPVPFLIPHRPSKSCCVAGYTIPEGSRILVNIWAMQRDSQVWKNSDEFEPERFLKEPGNGDYHGNFFNFLPFGSGRRICAGIPLAEKMTKYVLATLLHSFEWKTPEEVELDVFEKFGIVLKKATPLIAVPMVRLPALEQYS